MSSGTINHDQTKENSKAVFISIIITSVLLAIVIVGSLYFFKAMVSAESNAKQGAADRSSALVKLEKGYTKNLNSLKWVNKQQGRVMIPIDMAMENVVKDYNN